MRIYVGNLPYDVNEDELRQQFSAFGNVTDVSIPKDKDSGRSKGFGFVEMPTQAEAEAAIAALNRRYLLDYPREAARRIESLPLAGAAEILAGQPVPVIVPVWSW